MPLCKKCQLRRAAAQHGLEMDHVDWKLWQRNKQPARKKLTREQLEKFIEFQFDYFLSQGIEPRNVSIYKDKKGEASYGFISMHVNLWKKHNLYFNSLSFVSNANQIDIPKYTFDEHDHTVGEKFKLTIETIVDKIMELATDTEKSKELVFVEAEDYEHVKEKMENFEMEKVLAIRTYR